jgi:hypothetical protein
MHAKETEYICNIYCYRKINLYERDEPENFMGYYWLGNVTEKKSGPAFNKVGNSAWVAVMRRDPVKAEDCGLATQTK